jgi:hypothetical protein
MRSAPWIFLLGGLASCAAERTLFIDSNPPGALVRLDDTIVGTTPYQQNFDSYGTRRVTLYREGYRTASQLIVLQPKWFARFPLDLISEVLLPFGWKDPHEVKIDLEPESGSVTSPDLDAVLRRAEGLRLAEPTGPRPSTLKEPEKPTSKPSPDP